MMDLGRPLLGASLRMLAGLEEVNEGAIFIGFTGTPLLKADKQKSIEVFGRYIHTYKFSEGVEDGVVLDLVYEARDIEQKLGSQDKIDAWFEGRFIERVGDKAFVRFRRDFPGLAERCQDYGSRGFAWVRKASWGRFF